jgi:transposase
MRAIYPSDITREQFSVIAYDLQSARKATRPRTYDLYDIFCVVLYVLKEGCTWRGLMNLCLDAGYVDAQRVAEGMGYEAHIRGRGEEKREQEKNPEFKARRWVVEVCSSLLNRFRKLL